MKNGIPIAILGESNVGKSTLLNTLLDEDKAIVSDIAGTTRDTIEATLIINDISFRFIDTAGIRESKDIVEKIGIKKALKTSKESNLNIVFFKPIHNFINCMKTFLRIFILIMYPGILFFF